MKSITPPSPELVEQDVRRALAEDVGDGDRSAALVPSEKHFTTRVVCREDAILSGRPWFDETFRQLDETVRIEWQAADGARLAADSCLCTLRGPARAILSGERTALNFIQMLSATATRTDQYVNLIAGTSATILDTRKTLPGLRMAQKYAVTCGGGANHRIGLFDAIMIKENHIAAAGSISQAVRDARHLSPGLTVIVEVENLQQLHEAADTGADQALLDNFELTELETAVKRYGGQIRLEASGGITMDTLAAVAATGVDYISVGSLTKDIRAIDFSMRFE